MKHFQYYDPAGDISRPCARDRAGPSSSESRRHAGCRRRNPGCAHCSLRRRPCPTPTACTRTSAAASESRSTSVRRRGVKPSYPTVNRRSTHQIGSKQSRSGAMLVPLPKAIPRDHAPFHGLLFLFASISAAVGGHLPHVFLQCVRWP